MDETGIKDKIRTFVREKTKHPDLKDDQDFFQDGFVNSLFAMQLVLFVEKEFLLSVGDDDLALENFNSINAIGALVTRKQVVSNPKP